MRSGVMVGVRGLPPKVWGIRVHILQLNTFELYGTYFVKIREFERGIANNELGGSASTTSESG